MSDLFNYEHVPHPYRDGYSVLPRLRKIPREEIFRYEPSHFQRCLTEKKLARESQIFEVEQRLNDNLREAVRVFLLQEYPIPLNPAASLGEVVEQMQEDVVIHALEGEDDWMAYGHVCLPSSWRPEEKIGQHLRSLHTPIPGINLNNSSQLVETMVHHGPFERFIWSVVFDDRLNFHPDIPKTPFDVNKPTVYVKVERQVTVGFPEQFGGLFLLSESLLNEDEIDRPALANSIRKMNDAELEYKGLIDCAAELVNWLECT
ncbi:heme-dependent oxidative N-demethylase subunit alpha family protein [Thalassoglobus sp.]|uniref:heme-dependent oxidative N-demethylase subunit alpha family protein n=1 Tax=Thalassoglobus sp. TaxID=2795869 RepID=UPI003AA95A28